MGKSTFTCYWRCCINALLYHFDRKNLAILLQDNLKKQDLSTPLLPRYGRDDIPTIKLVHLPYEGKLYTTT